MLLFTAHCTFSERCAVRRHGSTFGGSSSPAFSQHKHGLFSVRGRYVAIPDAVTCCAAEYRRIRVAMRDMPGFAQMKAQAEEAIAAKNIITVKPAGKDVPITNQGDVTMYTEVRGGDMRRLPGETQ